MPAWRALILVLLFAALARANDGVPGERLARLSRGVNLSQWLWIPIGNTPEERAAFLPEADLRALTALGLTHVRLPFDPERVWDRKAGALREPDFAELRRAIDLCLGAGLAVVVDAHATGTPWTDPDADDGRFAALESLWGTLAERLAGLDPDRIFFEVLNEPHGLKKVGLWAAAQERVVAAIRAKAPHHTIIVTGDDWGGVGGLLTLKPPADSNVVYSFHFYEPHTFTHQGATWGAPNWPKIKGVPYPCTPETGETIAAAIADAAAAREVRQFAKEHWDAARIKSRIDRAVAWGREHRVPVYCGEYGAYRQYAPRESRLAWIRDTTSALNESGVGWAMWDFAGGFALMEGKPGSRTADQGVTAALGLPSPRP